MDSKPPMDSVEAAGVEFASGSGRVFDIIWWDSNPRHEHV